MTETVVVLETSKVATSADSSGTVSGVQLAAVFQSLVVGFVFQVALAAWIDVVVPQIRIAAATRANE